MNTIANHEGYQKHKDDPLVVMLMEYFRTQSTVTIPPVWKSFIEKSTEQTDINLLLSQLHAWGVNAEIDFNLRGGELLQTIYDSRLVPIFDEVDRYAKGGIKTWPIALEIKLISLNYVPSEAKRKMLALGNFSISGDISYTETGTIKYKVRRRIPNILATVPARWVLESCGPEVSDRDMKSHFLRDFQNGFAPRETVRSGGFGLREFWKKIFSNNETAKWDRDKLTSSMVGIFPRAIEVCKWDDEPPAYLELQECRRSAMKTDEDVARRDIKFSFRGDRRGRDRATEIHFPCFEHEDHERAAREGINVPVRRRMFNGFPQLAYTDPRSEDGIEQGDKLRDALRNIYAELNKAKSYDDARKAASK